MGECNEIISKIIQEDDDGEHKGSYCNAEKSALQIPILLTIFIVDIIIIGTIKIRGIIKVMIWE